MDVHIRDGDIAVSPSGGYVYLSGGDELLQRVRLAVLTAKGTFLYDRGFGTDYSEADPDEMTAEKLELLIREACADIIGAEIEVTAYDPAAGAAVIRIGSGDYTATTEVDLSGILQ